MRSIFLSAVLLAAGSSLADDTVVMKNGDVLSGDILKETGEHVYFRSQSVGAVSIQAKDIMEIRIQPEETGEIKVMPKPPKAKPKAKNDWSGQAGLSAAMRETTKSNASGVTGQDEIATYRIYGNLGWDSKPNKLRWDWTYRYSRDEYQKKDDFLNITQRYTRDFEKNYYATAKTMYQQDYRREIEHEYLQTAEMGVRWLVFKDLELSTSIGGGYHRYDRITYNDATNTDELVTRNQPKFIFDESLRWQIIQSLTLIQKYTHLGDLTDYHFVFTAGMENKLIEDVFLRLEYRLDRDTEVYYDDRGFYDKALLASMLYKF
jgi:opacity protein-like surface antigen